MNDKPDEVRQSINGLVGAELQRTLRPLLRERGWEFSEAWPEDHGWDSAVPAVAGGKTFSLRLVTCPELDETNAQGGALDDRWRVVIGCELGVFSRTKALREEVLRNLAAALHAACLAAGAKGIDWEVGGPAGA